MQKALTAAADKLQHTVLPALQQSTEALRRRTLDEDIPMEEVSWIIERDPGLALRLLRNINALRRKHLGSQVATIGHALMMMGLEQIRALPSAVPLVESITQPESKRRLLVQYDRAYHAARQAWDWARARKDMEANEVYAAALLHNLGEMLLWLRAPTKMAQVEAMVRDDGVELEEAQYVLLGFTAEQLTQELARRWSLPELLCDSLHPENSGNPRAFEVMLAARLTRTVEAGWYTHPAMEVLDEVAGHIKMEPGAAVARVHRVAAQAAREAAFNGTIPLANGLLLPSRPEADPEWTGDMAGTDNAEAGGTPAAAQTGLCLMPQPEVLRRSRAALEHAGPTQGFDALLAMVMEGLHDGAGLNRVVFLALSQDKSELRARAVAGAEDDPHLSQLRIDMEGGHLLAKLMEKPRALWVDEANRQKFHAFLPKALEREVGADHFLVMSVFAGRRPVGLFYADRHSRHHGACDLDDAAYERFKELVLDFAHALGRRER